MFRLPSDNLIDLPRRFGDRLQDDRKKIKIPKKRSYLITKPFYRRSKNLIILQK